MLKTPGNENRALEGINKNFNNATCFLKFQIIVWTLERVDDSDPMQRCRCNLIF